MAVMKKKDIDWKYYLSEIVSKDSKISDFERIEFAGFLLKRDMKENLNRHAIFEKLVTFDNCSLADIMASFIITESPESKEDLIDAVKTVVVQYYNEQINKLIEIEEKNQNDEKEIEEKLKKQNEADL